MISTPRTNAAAFNFHTQSPHTNINQDVVKADFARQLERELNELRAKLFELENMGLFTSMTPAEIVQAKRDAQRYRYLRDNPNFSIEYTGDKTLDAFIDDDMMMQAHVLNQSLHDNQC